MARDWTQLKKPKTGGGASRDIERLRFESQDTRIRFVGDVLPRYVYWVVTNEGKRHPLECLSFDRETEQFSSKARDPMQEIPESVYSDKPQFAYVCNVIDRRDGRIKLLDIKTSIYKQLVDYSCNPDYGSPADPENGYDIIIKKEKTGPSPQNVKYTAMPSRNTIPLTDTERQLELYELESIFKRTTYEEQKEWLLKNTAYFSEEVIDDLRVNEQMEDL
jgi:hypothetical protein